MSQTPSQGKGSRRRCEDSRKVRSNWDDIDWSKRSEPKKPISDNERQKDLDKPSE